MEVAELEALIEDLYKFICDTLAKENLSSAAHALRESLKFRISLQRNSKAANAPIIPASPSIHENNDLPEYGDMEEAMAEYEDFTAENPTILVHHKETESSPSPSVSSATEEVTMQSLINVAVMHGVIFRKDRKFMMEQSRKCYAVATATVFHLFNSEADMKPSASLKIDDDGFEVKLPPQGAKEKKKELYFEVVTPNKTYKLVAPSMEDRQRWLMVLYKGIPPIPTDVAYENNPCAKRSLPETPLDAEVCEQIEEDNDSLDNYEIMSSNKTEGEEDDIYNSLEDLAVNMKPPVMPPTPIKKEPPALPGSRRPSFSKLLGKKQATAPPPPPPDEELYDDTAAPVVPSLPARPMKAPPAPVRNTSRLHSLVYDDANVVQDDYDDASAGTKGADDDQDMYYDIADLAEERKTTSAVPQEDDVYDDTAPVAPKPSSLFKKQPVIPIGKRPTAAPPPPARKMQIPPAAPEEMEEYDEVGPVAPVPFNKKPPPPKAITKCPPPPPARKQSTDPPPEEEYDEVAAPQTNRPPPPPASSKLPASSALGRPPPPPAGNKPPGLKGTMPPPPKAPPAPPADEETYDEVGPPAPAAPTPPSALNLHSVKLKPTTKPTPKAAEPEDLSDPNTMLNRLAKLKKTNSNHKVGDKVEAPSSATPPVNKLKPSFPASKFQPANSAVANKSNVPANNTAGNKFNSPTNNSLGNKSKGPAENSADNKFKGNSENSVGNKFGPSVANKLNKPTPNANKPAPPVSTNKPISKFGQTQNIFKATNGDVEESVNVRNMIQKLGKIG